MAKRKRRFELPTITNPTQDQLRRFYNIAKNLNAKVPVTDDDYKFFMAVNFDGFDEDKYKNLLDAVNLKKEKGEVVSPEVMKQFIEQARLMIGSTENKDRLARIKTEMDAKNKTTAFSNAVNLFLAGADLASAQRQVQEYKTQLDMLQKPGALPVMGADPFLEAAKRSAETAPARETVAALAAGQQLGDIYRAELAMAPVAAGGQAGAVGALSQAAATRRRRGALEMMPALEQIRAQQQGERAQMASLSAQQAQAINRSAQLAAQQAQQQYNLEQQALAGLGAAGMSNRLQALGELGTALTPFVAGGRQPLPVSGTRLPERTPGYGAIQEQLSKPIQIPSRVDQFGRQRLPIKPEAANALLALGVSPEKVESYSGVSPGMNQATYNAALESGMANRLPGMSYKDTEYLLPY